ncbi:MAG: addiction module protein [Burkholderiaceae bacterium]
MPVTLEILQAQVLSLSKADRAHLLDSLVASLEVNVDAEAQWEQLTEERDAELESGTLTPVSLESAMARLHARFPG